MNKFKDLIDELKELDKRFQALYEKVEELYDSAVNVESQVMLEPLLNYFDLTEDYINLIDDELYNLSGGAK